MQDLIDAIHGCYLVTAREAVLMNNEVVCARQEDIAELEKKQDEIEVNFKRAQVYVQQWQRNLEEVSALTEGNSIA